MVFCHGTLRANVLSQRLVRQWVLSFPYPLRFVLANHPQVMGKLLGNVNRAISTYVINGVLQDLAGSCRCSARSCLT